MANPALRLLGLIAVWPLLFTGKHLAAESVEIPAVSIGGYEGPKATLFAIDDTLLPLRKDLCYYLSHPTVRAEPVLTPSRGNSHATDTLGVHFYGTVLREAGRFRMWYFGISWKKVLGPEAKEIPDWFNNFQEGPICYAESADGLHWTKPNLGQVEHNGSRDNNAIALPESMTEGAFLIRDDSDPDPARRYKMAYESSEGPRPTVQTATSSDGIVWTPRGRAAISAEPSSFYQFQGFYYVGAQNVAGVSEGGHRSGREGFVWLSPDFDRWLPQSGEAFLLPEPADPNQRGGDRRYRQAHLGVGAVSYGNVLVGIYCQWHTRPNPGDWLGLGTTYGNFGLVISDDGQHFREPVKGFVFLNRHDSEPAISPDVRFENILTQAGNGIINVGDETWIYHGRWVNPERVRDYYGEAALATLPRDRWGALGLYPHAKEGSVWSAPMTLGKAGCNLSLNVEGAAGVKVEIADQAFHLLPEFSGDNAGVAAADGLESAVTWPKAGLDSLAGKRVRLLIHLSKGEHAEPRLYAAYVKGG